MNLNDDEMFASCLMLQVHEHILTQLWDAEASFINGQRIMYNMRTPKCQSVP